MGLGGLLSPLLTATSNTVGAYEGAQADQAKQRKADALQQILQQRAQHEQEIKDLLTGAQTNHFNAQTLDLQNKPAPRDPTVDHATNRDYDLAHPTPAVPKEASTIPGTPEWENAEKRKAEIGAKFGYHPPTVPQLIVGEKVNPDGTRTPTYGEYNKGTHTIAPVDGSAMQPKSAGAGPSNPQMAASKANIESAMKTMAEYERKLAAGEATYGPFDATNGALGSSEKTQSAAGAIGGAESLIGNMAGASLRGSNSDLANYLKAKKFVAEAVLNTHKRPNQTQYEIEQELSGIGPRFGGWTSDDAKAQIAQSADRRNRMYHEVFGTGGGPAPTVPRGTSTGDVDLRDTTPQRRSTDPKPTKAQQIQAMVDAGKTDAEIHAKFP